MLDRVPTKPNRYAVYDDAHNFLRYEYHERADEPTEKGDPLNKANLLPNDVVTALGLTGNPQVKDALAQLSTAVNTSQYAWNKYEITSSEIKDGTGIVDGQGAITDTFYADSYEYHANGIFTLVNPQKIPSNWSSIDFTGKYIFNVANITSGEKLFRCSQSHPFTDHGSCYNMYAKVVSAKKTFVGQVSSYTPDTYPKDGVQNGFLYYYVGFPQYIDARVETGSYRGVGTGGVANPNSLTFSFMPKLIFIKGKNSQWLGIILFPALSIDYVTYSMHAFTSNAVYPCTAKKGIDGLTVYWYREDASSDGQLNSNGYEYHYVAIG